MSIERQMTEKKRIRAIALDLDGTLLTEKKEVSAPVRDALRAAGTQGVEILIATGRSYYSLPKAIFELPEIHYVITSNGAVAYELPERGILLENCIRPKRVGQLRELIQQYDLDAEVFFDGQGYMNEEYFSRIISGKTDRDISYVSRTRRPVPDVCLLMDEHIDRIENVCFFFDRPEDKEKCGRRLDQIPELTVSSVFASNLEIGSEYSDKMKGIKQILDQLSITSEELLTIGDGGNDIEMITYAGVGVAMGNAQDIVKEAADDVTLTNEEDGVAAAIRKYILD